MDDRTAEALTRIYRGAFDELVARLLRAAERGTDTVFLHAQLLDVMQLLAEVDAEARDWIQRHIPEAYRQGQHAALDVLRQAGAAPRGMTATFAGVHRTAVELLADNLYADLTDATSLVGRRVDDVFRRLGIETAARMRSTGTLARQGARDLTIDLLSYGLTGFVDGAGRNWRLDDYADMAVRTTVIEASNLGRINQQVEVGVDLVKMTEHHPTCPICAVYQGRVYSVSGDDTRYPALYETAFSRGFAIVHPRCKHSVVPYLEHLADDPAADRERSAAPFDVEPRTRRQRDAYEAGQRRKRQLRDDRRQWERFRATLPNDTPATFGAFRRMKLANSARWQQLQVLYREAGKAPTPVARPLVSTAITPPAKSYRKPIVTALDAIDRVHADGTLNDLAVTINASKSYEAAYVHRDGDGVEIRVSRYATHKASSFLHEVGHFLDHKGMGSGQFASRRPDGLSPKLAEALDAWERAVSESAAVKRIRELQTMPRIEVSDGGVTRTYTISRRFIDYSLQPHEMWARSYAQYVALRSGDTLLRAEFDATLEQIRTAPVAYPDQWEWADFEPIATAIDNVLEVLEWKPKGRLRSAS